MSKRPPKYRWNRVPTCHRPYKPCAVENVSSRTVPVSGLECSYGKNLQLGFLYEHIEIFVKKRVARRDLRRKPSQPGRPGSYEEALTSFQIVSVIFWVYSALLGNYQNHNADISLRNLLTVETTSLFVKFFIYIHFFSWL